MLKHLNNNMLLRFYIYYVGRLSCQGVTTCLMCSRCLYFMVLIAGPIWLLEICTTVRRSYSESYVTTSTVDVLNNVGSSEVLFDPYFFIMSISVRRSSVNEVKLCLVFTLLNLIFLFKKIVTSLSEQLSCPVMNLMNILLVFSAWQNELQQAIFGSMGKSNTDALIKNVI